MKKLRSHLCGCQSVQYQIRLLGRLGEDWSDWFDGMAITTEVDPTDQPITVLTGPVTDQAALHGLLTKVYNLGLPLMAVYPLDYHLNRQS